MSSSSKKPTAPARTSAVSRNRQSSKFTGRGPTRTRPVLKCRCGEVKSKHWHLACPSCWAQLPENMQNEVWAAYREKQGSPRHLAAIQASFQFFYQNGVWKFPNT